MTLRHVGNVVHSLQLVVSFWNIATNTGIMKAIKLFSGCELTESFSFSVAWDLAEYIHIIRRLYEDREGWLAPFPWCEEFRFHLDDIFTRLKFVSRSRQLGREKDHIVAVSYTHLTLPTKLEV